MTKRLPPTKETKKNNSLTKEFNKNKIKTNESNNRESNTGESSAGKSSADEPNVNIKSIILRSTSEIAELFKSIGNVKRLQILGLLLEKNMSFNDILKHTELSKTALANHIAQLVKKGLLLKPDRGRYLLSENGRQLLLAASIFYKDIQQKGLMDLVKMQQYYSEGYHRFQSSPEIANFLVKPIAKYQGCWISFLGAVSGVLKSFGSDYDFDIISVAGYTGYAFLINMRRGMLCASGPTALANWAEIQNGVENMGWRLERWGDSTSYPSIAVQPPNNNQTSDNGVNFDLLSSADKARAKNIFEKIKEEMQIHKRPAILWGLNIPEFGIINGFNEDAYIVSTYRWLIRGEENPIPYWALQSPGGLNAYFFRKIAHFSLEDLCKPEMGKEVLKKACIFAKGEEISPPGYVNGLAAFDEWIYRLSQETLEPSEYHGNSYCAACYQEARGSAAVFLSRMVQIFSSTPLGKYLSELITTYQHEEKFWRKFTTLFPFGFSGDFSNQKRKEGIEILKIIKEYETEALQTWEKIAACIN